MPGLRGSHAMMITTCEPAMASLRCPSGTVVTPTTLVSKPSIFFFNVTSTTEIYTLSLHDALPIFTGDFLRGPLGQHAALVKHGDAVGKMEHHAQDRKSTRLNSSHPSISYAVFCLKKKTSD